MLAVLVSLVVATVVLGTLLDAWCFSAGPFSARDTDWETRGVTVPGATAEQVYEYLIADLERRGYEICHERKRVAPDNRGELCVGNCGPVTSFRKGIIVAQGYVAGTDRQIQGGETAWDGLTLIWTFREKRGDTSIALSRIGHLGMAPQANPDTFVSEPAKISARFWEAFPGEVAREISSAVGSAIE